MKRNTIAFIMMLALVSNQGGICANATELDKSEDYFFSDVLETVGDDEKIDFDIEGEETRKLKEIKIEAGKSIKITNNSENQGMIKAKNASFLELKDGNLTPIKTKTDGILNGKSTMVVENTSEEEITVYMLEDFASNCTIENFIGLEKIDFDIKGEETRKLKEIKIEAGKSIKITNNSENQGMIKAKNASFLELKDGNLTPIKTKTDGILNGKSTMVVENTSEEEITVYMLEDFAENCTIEKFIGLEKIDFDITGEETRKLKEIKIEAGKSIKITNNSEKQGMIKAKEASFLELKDGNLTPIKTRTDGILNGKSTMVVENTSEEEITVYMLEDFAENCTIENFIGLEKIDFDIKGEETRKLKEIKIEAGKSIKITNNSEKQGMIKAKEASFLELKDGNLTPIKTRTEGILNGKSTMVVENTSEEEITVYMLEDFAENCTIEKFIGLEKIDFDITGEETRKLKEIKIEAGKSIKITNNSEKQGMIKAKEASFLELKDGNLTPIKTRTDGILNGKSTMVVENTSEEEITVYMLEDFAENCTIENFIGLEKIDFDIKGEETRKLKEIKIEAGKSIKITNNSEKQGMIKAKEASLLELKDGNLTPIKTRTEGILNGKSTMVVENTSEEEITVYMLEDFAKNCTIEEYAASSIIKYNVIFMVDGVQYGETQTIEQGNSAVKPEDPKKEGFIFTNWDISFDKVTSDLVVNAQFNAVVSNEKNDQKEEGQFISETTNGTTTSNGNSESASSGDASKGFIAGLGFILSGLAIGGIFKRKEN